MKKLLIAMMMCVLVGCQTAQKESSPIIEKPAQIQKSFEYKIVKDVQLDKGDLWWFQRSLNSMDYGYLTVEDPTGSSPSKIVERFEVKPGDCEADMHWSDCDNDRERSELTERGGRNWAGSTFWYRWYMYVPEGYINIYPTKVALGQFHQEKGQPVFMFQNYKGGLFLDDQKRDSKYYKLIDEKDLRGKWHKIVVNAHWSQKKDGFFKVWVNDELMVEIKNKTMTEEYSYFKYGVYRSFMTRYKKATGQQAVPGQIVYYTGVKKSETKEGLN